MYQTYERVFKMFQPFATSHVPFSLPLPNIPNVKTMLVALGSSTNQLTYQQLSNSTDSTAAAATETSSTQTSTTSTKAEISTQASIATATSSEDNTNNISDASDQTNSANSTTSSPFDLSLIPHLSISSFAPRQQADLYGRAKRTAILHHRRMVAIQSKTFKQYDDDEMNGNGKTDIKSAQSTTAVKGEQVKAELTTAKTELTSTSSGNTNNQPSAPEIIEIDDDNQDWE